MSKIAIIVAESFTTMRGQANAEINRIKYLLDIADYRIDVFSFCICDSWLSSKLRHTSRIATPPIKNVNGVDIHFKWRKFSIIDYFLQIKLHKKPIVNGNWKLKFASLFKSYDLIMAHSDDSGELALYINKKYGIPYCVTWHGSDIHTGPFKSQYSFNHVKQILDGAAINFMVSKKLLETAEQISSINNKIVLYNGVSDAFYRFTDEVRKTLRFSYGLREKRIVAFAGNLVPVKNPMALPEIFKLIHKKNPDIDFWIMGTGKMLSEVKEKADEYELPLYFLGSIPSEEMPKRLNCVDVLILPSLNEGLPLVTIEALACGAKVVGSNVGGIPEAIGYDNSFELDDLFYEKVAERTLFMLNNEVHQDLKDCFSWKETAKLENEIYLRLLQEKHN